jgi:hypothetical protein
MSHQLELCKELYELSGWMVDDYYMGYPLVWATDEMSKGLAKHQLVWHEPWRSDPNYKFVAPAYDLGYLLRKLQGYDCGVYYSNQWQQWIATAHDNNQGKADTPENAAAKLAIELFKQNILTKDGSQ